ncbi:MAG: hypothetical protein KIT85_14575 [Pseudolabrys sp.]|nr:hypothetical protein [Pseudolabrys sp.]
MKAVLVVVGILLPFSVVNAADNKWPTDLICASGVHAYFYLKEPPRQIGKLDGWTAFRSKSGATYDCQVRGRSIALKWKNDSGPMSSESTQFDERGANLTVRPKGLSEWRFQRTTNGYRSLD